MLNTLNLSQDVTVSYKLTNAMTQDYRSNGTTLTIQAALRMALDMLLENNRDNEVNFQSLAAQEYLQAVVDCLDHGQGGGHA